MSIILFGGETDNYLERMRQREGVLAKATMDLVQAFMDDGDDLVTAQGKVKAFSDEITTNAPGAKYDFVLGNVQPLKDAVNASVLSYMTANTNEKINLVISLLNKAV